MQYLVSSIAVTATLCVLLGSEMKSKLIMSYIRVRNSVLGDPYAPKKEQLESVEVFPNLDEDHTIYDICHSFGFDVTHKQVCTLSPIRQVDADFATVWDLLTDDIPEIEDLGRICVVSIDRWGKRIKRVYTTTYTTIPLPLKSAPVMQDMTVVHVGVYADVEVDNKKKCVYENNGSTPDFKQWINDKADFDTQNCKYALADFVKDNNHVLEVLEKYYTVRFVVTAMFADLSSSEFVHEISWPMIDLTRGSC